MPEFLLLQEFGSRVWDAFGTPPYHVGSSLTEKRDWRDVDVRLILSDEQYEAMGLGDPVFPQRNAKWVALCLAFSALGKQMTGLPIDFQIQQQTYANEKYVQPRSAIGHVPMRFIDGLRPVHPAALAEYEREMDIAIPEITASIERRERLAIDARNRQMIQPATSDREAGE